MIKKIAYTLFLTWPTALLTNEPKDWQLGFQKSASKSMDDIVWFHDYMLVPIITAITAFVLFLLLYVCVRYRASKNQVPSTTSHNTLIEVIWTLVPCLILIVMAVPSFKVLYSQDEIPKADVTIKAIGYQWYWGYEYPDEKIIFDSYMIDEKDLIFLRSSVFKFSFELTSANKIFEFSLKVCKKSFNLITSSISGGTS